MKLLLILFTLAFGLDNPIWNGRNPVRERDTKKFITNGQTIPIQTNLKYYGGPLIPFASVFTIYWGSRNNVRYASELETWYSNIFSTSWYDILHEYSVSSYNITSGAWSGYYNYTSSYQSGTIDDSVIKAILLDLVTKKVVPFATYYPIHFAPGINVVLDGTTSCTNGGFCAYHNTVKNGNGFIYYGIMPDQSGTCSTGCGTSNIELNNLCSVTSHELSEAVTDSAVGLAMSYDYPLGYYAKGIDGQPDMGENADFCVQYNGLTISRLDGKSYPVQYIYSIEQKGCALGALPKLPIVPTPLPTPVINPSPPVVPSSPSVSPSPSSPSVVSVPCSHSPCVRGIKLPANCSPCSYKISLRDLYCSTVTFDRVCVNLARRWCPELRC